MVWNNLELEMNSGLQIHGKLWILPPARSMDSLLCEPSSHRMLIQIATCIEHLDLDLYDFLYLYRHATT